jgi:hypothetical protein
MYQEDTELEANYSDDENITENEEATSETELEAEQDDEVISLSKSELEERERAIRKDQDKRWKDRIKGQKGDESSKEDGVKEGVATKEEIAISRLEARGIFDSAKQQEVLKFMRREEITDVSKALEDDYLQSKLKKVDDAIEKERATGSPYNRTSRPREKTPEELARLAETGKIASSKEDRKKALAALQSKYGRT